MSTSSEQCSICSSDWLYKAPKGIHTLCEECYGNMNKDVIAYHTLQEDAHKDVIKGNIEKAIKKLRQVQEKRNELGKYFKNTLNTGHSRFANDAEFARLADYEE